MERFEVFFAPKRKLQIYSKRQIIKVNYLLKKYNFSYRTKFSKVIGLLY